MPWRSARRQVHQNPTLGRFTRSCVLDANGVAAALANHHEFPTLHVRPWAQGGIVPVRALFGRGEIRFAATTWAGLLMSQSGQNAKNSVRAYLVRSCPRKRT